ncbi:MAG: response regulator transcription factor [Flavobacteriales bacterium]|nr:response regulator transcription factor [Flavobacteriales bacterium]
MIRLLIVDDHEMIRNGLMSLISDEEDMTIAGFATNGREAVAACDRQPIDVVLMDLMMPDMNGVEATGAISRRYPNTRVLAVTINEQGRYIKEALKAGAAGYILKHSSKEEILTAIRTVASGRPHFSGEVLARISEEFAKGGKRNDHPVLTKKEQEVLQLISFEFSNQEIAEQLGCGMRTVDTHKRNLIKKLEVRNVVGLVKFAMREGMIEE